jgi:hypothetical protein
MEERRKRRVVVVTVVASCHHVDVLLRIVDANLWIGKARKYRTVTDVCCNSFGGMSSVRSEMTLGLDEVRNYLIQTGALSEAEKLYHLPSSNSTKALASSSSASASSSLPPSVSYLKDRIFTERELEKEKILRNLLTKRHESAMELQQEDEEMKQLQLLETKLSEENYKISLMKQELKNEMKSRQRSQLDEMAIETREELEILEKKRIEMERNIERKKLEIFNLQNELSEAEKEVLAQDQPPPRAGM